MEYMCQLTERLTEHKYQGSYEQIGKAIVKYATNPGLDIINLFEQIVFCYLIGNNDMHLKNFSLFKDPIQNYILSPAYDLVASSLLLPEDKEELALTLNGKKKKIKQADFKIAINNFNIDQKVLQNIFSKFAKLLPKWNDFIEISFLPEPLKEEYKKLIVARAKKLELI